MTIPMTVNVAIRNGFCGNMRRYWNKIDSFVKVREMLYTMIIAQKSRRYVFSSCFSTSQICCPSPLLVCAIIVMVVAIEASCVSSVSPQSAFDYCPLRGNCTNATDMAASSNPAFFVTASLAYIRKLANSAAKVGIATVTAITASLEAYPYSTIIYFL